MKKLSYFAILALLGLALSAKAQDGQEEDYSYKPLKLDLNEDGSKYVRFIIWHQHWVQTNNLAVEDASLEMTHLARRSRFLAYAQISPRFLILTHFGLNNLTPGNLTALGNNGDSPQLFLHDAWTEFRVTNSDALYIGGGLHYWKGLTRLANQSTLNFMTLDNTRPFVQWHSLGVTDQFARHLGAYAKGKLGKFDYRLAVNNPGANGFQRDYGAANSNLTYDGFLTADEEGDPTGNTIIEGYFRYNLWDSESTKLPYVVGSYLGKKRVFALGAGFFAHPNGMYNNEELQHESVSHFAVDAFLDMPLSGDDCLNVYASFINFNYGNDYVSRWGATGTNIYGQVGYKLPGSKFMPYVAFQSGNYEGFEDNTGVLDIGLNYFINGHSSKLTLEYHTISNDPREGNANEDGDVRQIRLQAHIFL